MAIKDMSIVRDKYQYAYYNSDIPLEALKMFHNKKLKMVRNITTGAIYNSVRECAKSLGVSACTVTSAIKNYKNCKKPNCKGNELEYIDIYDLPKEVVNVNTGRIYRNISEASKDTGLDSYEIYKTIIGQILDIDGDHWDYYNNGDSYWLRESSAYSYKYTPIINISTDEIFMGIKFAVKKYELEYKEIHSVCVGETYMAGGYQWRYWEKGKNYALKEIRSNTTRVICYTTGEIFDTLDEACEPHTVKTICFPLGKFICNSISK